MAVWKAALKMADPKNMAIFGSSAGGALTLAMVLRAKQDELPLPAAIAPGTPMADLTNAGDTFHTNAMLDNVLVAPRRKLRQARRALCQRPRSQGPDALAGLWRHARLSADDPHHRNARSAAEQHGARASQTAPGRRRGVAAGVSKASRTAQYYRDASAPETKEAFEEIARFFDKHLGK